MADIPRNLKIAIAIVPIVSALLSTGANWQVMKWRQDSDAATLSKTVESLGQVVNRLTAVEGRVNAIEMDRARSLSDWTEWRRSVGSDINALKDSTLETRNDVRWIRSLMERGGR